MGTFKNEKNGTWYVQFRYTDWQGLRQQKLKRGFATKREAQEWERAFLTEKKADVTMPFKTFTELYEKDVRPKLKENTWLTKEHIIKTKILPYFEHKRLCDISAKDVIAWQNEIRKQTNSSGEPLSQGYLKTIHNQLSALFNHAIRKRLKFQAETSPIKRFISIAILKPLCGNLREPKQNFGSCRLNRCLKISPAKLQMKIQNGMAARRSLLNFSALI